MNVIFLPIALINGATHIFAIVLIAAIRIPNTVDRQNIEISAPLSVLMTELFSQSTTASMHPDAISSSPIDTTIINRIDTLNIPDTPLVIVPLIAPSLMQIRSVGLKSFAPNPITIARMLPVPRLAKIFTPFTARIITTNVGIKSNNPCGI